MGWFIGQSAVMIVLAFLLGLLVGWILWGRRVRVLVKELAALRRAAAADEERAQAAEADAEQAREAAPAVRIPAPRAEVEDTAELEIVAVAAEETLTEDDLAGKAPLDEAVLVTVGTAAGDDTVDWTDDLVRIEGIGPKIAEALSAAGIRTYAQLADADDGTLWAALHAAGITFAPSLATWARQARLLADGDESGFLALTDLLVAGREVLPDAEPLPDPDNLARIEGIGPKISAALIAAGIRTYRQLAQADGATLSAAVEAAGINFAPSLGTWAQQAQLLADGDEEAFLKLTDELIAGRRAEDLERIEGIGPRFAEALRAAGIRTYHQLAGASERKLRKAIEQAGLSFAPSIKTWAQQAKLLADGDEEGFADLTRRLVAGRDEGRA